MDEDPAIVRVPEVVRIAIVAVQPQLRIVALHVEHVQIAVRAGNVWNTVCTTAL